MPKQTMRTKLSQLDTKSRLLTLAVVAVVGAGAFALPTTYALKAFEKQRDARRVIAYAHEIEPLAKEGGQLVVTEMRPSIADIQSGKVSPEQFRLYAARWRARFVQIRNGFHAVDHSDDLEAIASVYDRSLRLYIEAIDGFVEASRAPIDQMNTAFQPAIKDAEEADSTYDVASHLLSAEFRRLGLKPLRPAA